MRGRIQYTKSYHTILYQSNFIVIKLFYNANYSVYTGVFIFSIYSWKGVKYGDYEYPPTAEFFGWLLALASMLWIPGMAIYMVAKAPGSTFWAKLRLAFTPDQRIAKEIEIREGYAGHDGEMVIV